MSADPPETERPLGTRNIRYEDNIKMKSKGKVMGMQWGRLGQSRDQRGDRLHSRLQCKGKIA